MAKITIKCECGHECEYDESEIHSHRLMCGDSTKVDDVEKLMTNAGGIYIQCFGVIRRRGQTDHRLFRQRKIVYGAAIGTSEMSVLLHAGVKPYLLGIDGDDADQSDLCQCFGGVVHRGAGKGGIFLRHGAV